MANELYLAPVSLIPEEDVLEILITCMFVSLWIQSEVMMFSIIVNFHGTSEV